MRQDYKADLVAGRERLADLLAQREEIEMLIAEQRQRVVALASLCDETENVGETLESQVGGITNAIRTALRAAGSKGLTPVEVRSSLSRLSFPIHEYSNVMSSIHTVLKRLCQSGQVRQAIREGRDESVYQWIGENYGAPSSLANQLADLERDQRQVSHAELQQVRNHLRQILRLTTVPLTVGQMRESLKARGCPVRSTLAIQGAIRAILREYNKTLDKTQMQGGQVGYRWKQGVGG